MLIKGLLFYIYPLKRGEGIDPDPKLGSCSGVQRQKRQLNNHNLDGNEKKIEWKLLD